MKLTLLLSSLVLLSLPGFAEDWPQFQFNARHSGNAADRTIAPDNLGLQGAVALSDGIYTSPVVADGKVYVVDGAGVAWCLDAASLEVVWKFASKGGAQNCNNVSSPVVAGGFLHFGTTSGFYYVLNRATGAVVAEIDCQEPVFSTPVAGKDRVYFATLGSRVYSLKHDGGVVWQWDFVKEVIGFHGNRWSGEDWVAFRGDRVTWKDHFVCSRDICLLDRTVVVPAGGRTLFLEDTGDAPKLRATGEIPNVAGNEFPATFGQSADDAGNVYVQWHRRDNAGRVDIMRLEGGVLKTGEFVPGTETNIRMEGLLSFSPVSIRGSDVFRVRPENGLGLQPASDGRKGSAGAQHEASDHSAGPHAEPRDLRRARWRVECRAARWRQGVVVSDRVRRTDQRPGRGRGRTHLCPVRRRLSLRLRPGRQSEPAHNGPRYMEDPQSAHRQIRRREIRLVHELRQLRRHQRERPGPQRAAAHALGAAARRHGETSARVRRRPPLHAHGGGADHRRRAGHRPPAVAALLAGRVSVLHLAALHRRQAARAAGRD